MVTDSCRDGWNVRNCSWSQVQVFGDRWTATLLKKRFWHRCFPVNSAKFLRTLFFINFSNQSIRLPQSEDFFFKAWSKTIQSFRSSHPNVLVRKGVLKTCGKFTREHPCRSVITIKLQSNFIEIAPRDGCSPVNLLRIFRTLFHRNTSDWLFLEFRKFHHKVILDVLCLLMKNQILIKNRRIMCCNFCIKSSALVFENFIFYL